jgi:CheY-like chemotaxis protein
MMPEMDGFQFLHELREHPEWGGIPVVVVTAKELTPEESEELNGTVAQVFSKGSFSTEDLLQHLRKRVRQHLNAGT